MRFLRHGFNSQANLFKAVRQVKLRRPLYPNSRETPRVVVSRPSAPKKAILPDRKNTIVFAAVVGVVMWSGTWGGCTASETGAPVGSTSGTGGAGAMGGSGGMAPECNVTEAFCENHCVDVKTDAKHCGSCDVACGELELCNAGKCMLACSGAGVKNCAGTCRDTLSDLTNCGECGASCSLHNECVNGECKLECLDGASKCGEKGCLFLSQNNENCGSCGKACEEGRFCSQGLCSYSCLGGTALCDGTCVSLSADPAHCGSCATACSSTAVCSNGTCQDDCAPGELKCGQSCHDVMSDKSHCGNCDTACPSNKVCESGVCKVCNPLITDCDGDGWNAKEGDCCDLAGSCGANPALVNPGAVEVADNGIDDNCNGKIDLMDLVDTAACDDAANILSNSTNATDYAKAIGICRTTTKNPSLKNKTWGLLDAKLVRADGSPIPTMAGYAIVAAFEQIASPLEGKKAIVLSSGIASAVGDVHAQDPSSVNIAECGDPVCIKDWFSSANPPLKAANELPHGVDCGSGSAGAPMVANDSRMLVLTLRAPTNARALEFSSFFLSQEFPNYVCEPYNDQAVALVETTTPTAPIANPADKNILFFSDVNGAWPIGISVAKGTPLFSVCDLMTAQQAKPLINQESCSKGSASLEGSAFFGYGGTGWLTSRANVNPGQEVTLRIAIWDVGDVQFSSTLLVDQFKWLLNATVPGTN